MRAPISRQVLPVVSFALIVASCSYPHPGPSGPSSDGALPATSGAASSALPQAKPGSVNASPGRLSSQAQNPPSDASSGASDASMTEASPGTVGDDGLSFDNIDVTDTSLNGQLAVLRVGSEPTANNLLSVFAGLKNKTDQNLYLEVQTIYKDKIGNALNKGSWVPLTLKPHEETEYRSSAISEAAVDFLVRIRRGANPDQN